MKWSYGPVFNSPNNYYRAGNVGRRLQLNVYYILQQAYSKNCFLLILFSFVVDHNIHAATTEQRPTENYFFPLHIYLYHVFMSILYLNLHIQKHVHITLYSLYVVTG